MYFINRLTLLLSLTFGITHVVFAEPLTLPQAQQIALSDSPLLAEILARYKAALEVPEQAAALPDPTLTIGLLSVPTDTFNLDQEAMTQFQVGFSQSLPWASERRLAKSSAENLAEATAAELDEARNRLRRDVTRNWWTLYFVDQSLTVVDENLQRLRELNQIAQSRYRVGKGLQQDTLLAQLQLSAQLEQQVRLRGQRRNIEARLNALLASPETLSIYLPTNLPVDAHEIPAIDQLIDTALLKRPWIHQQQRKVDAAKDRQELARKGLLPDLTLGASYGYRQDAPNGSSRADLFSINLGIKLPIYASSKQHREIGQRGAELVARKAALRGAQLQVRSEVIQSVSDYEQAQEQADLLEQGMIPQSKQTVASMLAGYQVGKVDFMALIQAQLMVNRLRLQYWKAISDSQKAYADLEAAVGTKELITGKFDQSYSQSHFNGSIIHE
ncbi:MAG: TolC family protein [Motiliproteus sp.]